MKKIRISIVVLLLMLGLATVLLWTPDSDLSDMQQKYANTPSQFVTLPDGSRIHYRDQGDPTRPVLVLIHGTSASLHTWEPIIKEMGSSYRMVSLDLPGHGFTGTNPARDYSHAAMVDAVFQVMQFLSINRATLVGNSLGGTIAWKAALSSPEKVNALVLLAPSGVPRAGEATSNIGFKLLSNPVGQALMRKITPRAIIEKSLRQTVENDSMVTEAMVDRYWEILRLPGNRQAMIDLANTPRDSDAWLNLSDLTVPILTIWGESDGVLPIQMADSFLAELPEMTFIRLPDVGHLPMEEATTQVAAQIDEFCRIHRC